MRIIEIVGIFAGLTIALALVWLLFFVSIMPLRSNDVHGFSSLQTRSGVYNRGFTLEEALGVRRQNPFGPEHLVMLPAVDTQIDNSVFGAVGPTAWREILVYEHLTFRPVGPSLRPNGFNNTANPPLWLRSYPMNLPATHNKQLTLAPWIRAQVSGGTHGNVVAPQTLAPAPGIPATSIGVNSPNGRVLWAWAQHMSPEGLNIMVNGERGRTNILFFQQRKPERLVMLHRFGNEGLMP
jgi:hypothetical protein